MMRLPRYQVLVLVLSGHCQRWMEAELASPHQMLQFLAEIKVCDM